MCTQHLDAVGVLFLFSVGRAPVWAMSARSPRLVAVVKGVPEAIT
jgi:hypothetical protein